MQEVGTINKRVLEAYIGEYASGKSEMAINRAVELKQSGKNVTLVDLDLVEPFYTLRPIKLELESLGIDVIAWETRETMGLGEAGSILKPEMRWALRRETDVILDIGYGVEGARTLNLVEGAREESLKLFAVINISRPMTASVEDIVEYVLSLGTVHGLINNTHLGDETDWEVIEEGAKILRQVSKEIGISVIFTAVDKKLKTTGKNKDSCGNPIKYIHRYMPRSFW
ncbi:hypothetical protein MFMK1_000299 [Metallumcola ferriviriculae]|uniref:Uncharacterized protein n=1 Tax=Metallumcola ferriviriculae TaxID=3039180 RepID=A0AAU0UJZ4_9FIRM|nr:hypothetical protein MFMK1_000299 [Desulfitibacteraceae bacterium MK1]